MRSALLLAAALLLGCSKSEPEEPAPAAPAATTSTPKPVDHLAPNELLEGKDKALGLVLPRGAIIQQAFVDVVYVQARVKLEAMVEYVKARVREGSFTKSDKSATFERVKIPTNPGVLLRVRIERAPDMSIKVEVRDVTPPPNPNLPNEEERWKQVGMTKDGRLLPDPKRNE
jgi:hypothetical protein